METGIFVNIAENPLDCVAEGTGKTLDDAVALRNLLVETERD